MSKSLISAAITKQLWVVLIDEVNEKTSQLKLVKFGRI